jgi:hypothetical protein
VRERNRFGGELWGLRDADERDLSGREFEGAQPGGRPPRTIILVSGTEYPRYKMEKVPKGVKPKWWVLTRKTPQYSPDGENGLLSAGRCLLPSERTLKTTPGLLAGSEWRLRCLRLAFQKLRADPDVRICFFDLDLGVEERILLKSGTLSSVLVSRYLKPDPRDYRLQKTKTAGTGAATPAARSLEPLTGEKFPIAGTTYPPPIRYCPFVTTLGVGPVDEAKWLSQFAQNTTWLAAYEKKPEGQRLASMDDVYRRIVDIGTRQPYTLHEFHQFGHAGSSAYNLDTGPAYLNTDHVQVKDRKGRHPLDLDARAVRDFEDPRIDRKLFRMAFARGAMSYVWGCNWSRELFDIIGQTLTQLKGTLSDKASFTFRWRKDTGGGEAWFRRLMGLKPTDKTEGVVKTGKELRDLFRHLLNATYMQQLADASAHCVTGGVPAVGSDYDEKPENGEPCLTNIPMAPLYGQSDNMTPVLRFYTQNLGIVFNRDGAHKEFGRGFALYCPHI